MLIALLTLAIDLHRPLIPVHFEPNRGQVGGETEWIAKAPGGTLYIKGSGIAFETSEPAKKPRIMRFVGANAPIPSRDRQEAVAAARGQGLEPTGGYSNYFDGRDEKNWRSGIPHYAKVRYESLYKGIDLVYYATPDRQIEYDLEVQPAADLHQIELAFEGFDKIEITDDGDLALHFGRRVLTQHRPKVLQNGQEIRCTYKLLPNNHVTLRVDAYDDTLPLTVDPVLDFSTFLGGPGADGIAGVGLDSAGNIYVGGVSETPANPSLNPFQQTNTVVQTAFVARLSPNADKLLYYSALRSTGYSGARALSVDDTGSPILVGVTGSPDFPLKNAFLKDYAAAFYTGFVAKFSPDGKSIVYSSYFGGSGGSDDPYGSMVDHDGALIFSGSTESRDIPIKNALQPRWGGGTSDCFVAKVDAKGALVFSTYFGGSGTDFCGAVAWGPSGSIYFGGSTFSTDLPLKNPIQTTLTTRNGSNTAFVARLSGDGNTLEYGTLLGGPGSGGINSIALNGKGEIYLGGSAYIQGPFATVNAFQNRCDAIVCGIVMKLDPTGQKILTSTFLTGSEESRVNAIKIGSDDSLYITGLANSADFPTVNSVLPYVVGRSTSDVYVTKFLGDVHTLVYSTFVGATSYIRTGLTLDSSDRVYVGGTTGWDAYPVKNAFQKTFGGGIDGILFRISDSSVVEASPLTANPGQVQFRYVQGGPPIAPQNVQVMSADAPFSFTASANASWVTVLPQTGTTPATVSIGASALAPGNYTATVTLTPGSGAPLAIPIALKVLLPAPVLTSVEPSFVPLGSDDTTITFHGSGFTPETQLLLLTAAWGYPVVYVDAQTLQTTMPYLSFLSEGSYPFSAVNPQSDVSGMVTVSIGRLTPVITSVVNAASLLSGPLASGEMVQISGSNFGPASQFSVVIGGALAKVVSSSDTQALVIVPPQGPGFTSADVIVTSGALPSLPMILPLATAALGVFTADGSGAGPALFSGAASPGSTITLFGTGVADLTLPLKVKIGNEDAAVTSVSPVDGQPGWFQVSVTIPSDLPTDAPVAIVFCIGGLRSQEDVTVALMALSLLPGSNR